MPFVLRDENTTDNPSLPSVYGHQITDGGRMVYWKTDNGITRCIILLGEGEMSGIYRLYHHGEVIPEYIDGVRIWRFHPGTLSTGMTDPIQGKPEFFPEDSMKYTFSGMAYVEIRMTAAMSAFAEGGQPDGFKIMVFGKRCQNYTASGGFADNLGVATTSREKFFSNNNALIAVDILLNDMRMKPDRIDWPSFVAFRNHCQVTLTEWLPGSERVLANPTWGSLANVSSEAADMLYKSAGTNIAGEAGATTTNTVPSGDIEIEWTLRQGLIAVGLTSALSATNTANMLYSITCNHFGQTVVKQGDAVLYTDTTTFTSGSIFRIKLKSKPDNKTDVSFYRNDTLIHSMVDQLVTYGASGVRGAFTATNIYSVAANIKMFPVSFTTASNGKRNAQRFTADIVFPSEVTASLALEQVFSRAPGCHWQDVNGKIKFIVGPSVKDPKTQTVSPGDRVVAADIVYDPKVTQIKSNIVKNSFSAFTKPTEDKINFMRMEFRDLDDEFYKKDYSFVDRPRVRDLAEALNDSGIISVGVATKSLTDRIAEASMRMSTDLDVFVQLQGMPSTYHVAKGDVIRLAHDVPDWDIYNTRYFIVNEEVFESTINSIGKKSYMLQIYDEKFYSDTETGPITPRLNRPLIYSNPPKITAFRYTVITEQNGENILYKLDAEIDFDTTYSQQQIARIYYKLAGSTDSVTSIIQVNAGTTTHKVTISPLIPGTYQFRIVTESVRGNPSIEEFTASISVQDVSGAAREELKWIVANLEEKDGTLKKVDPVESWTNSFAYSTRRIGNKALSPFMDFTVGAAGGYQLGLGFGKMLNNNSVNYAIDVGSAVGKVLRVLTKGTVTYTGTWLSGDTYRIGLNKLNEELKFYRIRAGVETVLYTATNNILPLFVDARINTTGSTIPQCYIYGNLEDTDGIKPRWTYSKNVLLDSNDDAYKSHSVSSYAHPDDAGTFSLEYLDSDGTIDFVAVETNKERAIGLSYSNTIPGSAGQSSENTIDYAIILAKQV